ncbi:MAG: hypothetical protein R8F63_05390 [Acidimicrobiales bacterium]|nr:hypothetical protein [Acidimicrobiales bacterium]
MRWRAAMIVVALGLYGLATDDVAPSRVAMTISADEGGVLDP